MPKRKREDKITKYKEKIKKLEEKSSLRHRRRYRHSHSEAASVSSDDVNVENRDNEIRDFTEPTADPLVTLIGAEEALPVPPLDPVYVSALGETSIEGPKYGEEIHVNLTEMWTPVLAKGLPKDRKEKILSECLIPSNCKMLKAPTLNPEIMAAITETSKMRDKRLEMAQQQLGQGLSAVNRAMTLLLTADNKIEVIRYLSDACRILSDLHNMDTENRKKLLVPSLDKSFINIIKDCDRDDTLFGDDLNEKIKLAKAIEKQGLAIKKTITATTQKPSATSTLRPRQGNWPVPSRFSSNRGGRGTSRTGQPTRRPAGPGAQPPTQHSRPATYNYRGRAPQRH